MLDQISAFFAHNYLWLIFIGIVLVMALIGYIADKKSLIKISNTKSNDADTPIIEETSVSELTEQNGKTKKTKKTKEKKEKTAKDIKSLEHIALGDELVQKPVVEEFKIEEVSLPEPKFEDIVAPISVPTTSFEQIEKPNIKSQQEATPIPVDNIPQELFQPMGDINFTDNKEEIKEEADIWQI